MAGSKRHIALSVFLAGGVALSAAAFVVSPATSGIQQALQDLERREYARAEQLGVALATDPETPAPRAWAIVAAARQRRGQRESATRAYRLFLAACDSPDMRQFALKQMQACQQQPRKRQAPAAPSRRLSTQVLRRLAEVHDRQYTESSEHFIVKARNPGLAKLVAVEAEVALDRICRVILAGQAYPHSVTINVWADHDTYRSHATDAPEWSGGSFSFAMRDGTATRRIDLTQRDAEGRFAPIMIDRVLPHEMCHLVLREYFGDAACPLFLNEGLAMMAEYVPETRRIELAGHAIAGKAKISLEELLLHRRYSLRSPGVFYAESFSFIEFLHSRMTNEQFRSFLENVKAGCTVSDALQRSLYVPATESFLASLASAWEDHAVEQAQYVRALAAASR